MPQWKNKVSVVIIARDEEKQIADCIISCQSLTDDILVVDSGSRDMTREVASEAGARIFEKKWEGYGSSRNYGAEHAEQDWILNIDADERPDEEMIRGIGSIDLNKNTLYSFRRLNYLGGKPVLHGEWNPDYKQRLYHRSVTKWDSKAVHEGLEMQSWHRDYTLPGILHHYSYEGYDEMVQRLDKYAKLGAEELMKAGISPGLSSRLRPFFRFMKSYYLKGGFKDGELGRRIAVANAEAVRKKYAYLKDLLNK